MTPRQQLITLWGLLKRQAVQMVYNYVYILCMVVFPLLCTFFFADLMKNGLPTDMPAGAVDLDQTSTSRKLVRTLDAMQLTSVKKIYPNATEARRAMQRGEIYGFFYIPENFNKDVQAGRQPVVSFYYNGGYILAGSMLYKDMKTTATLGTAAVGMTKLAALGMTEREIMANLQPITVDTRITHNPTMDYNVYLSTSMIPTCLGIFIFLITVYSLGTELKFRSGKRWMGQAKGNIWIAMTAKMLPQTFVFTAIVFAYLYGLYGVMHFPYYCSKELILFNGFLLVLACQGFGGLLRRFCAARDQHRRDQIRVARVHQGFHSVFREFRYSPTLILHGPLTFFLRAYCLSIFFQSYILPKERKKVKGKARKSQQKLTRTGAV